MSKIHIAAGCIALLVAANASAELRTYDVDFRYQREVYQALRDILQVYKGVEALPILSDFSYGSVQLLPNGQIVVDTSAATHAQIEELLAAVKARQADATPRVTLRYWVVFGTSAEQPTGDAPPPILGDVLNELRRVHYADLNFRVLGTATLVTESGQEGQVISTPLGAEQRVFVRGDTATAAIELQYVEPDILRRAALAQQNGPAFATLPDPYVGKVVLNVTLERGEFLVLGESTVRTFQLDGTVFYIVHWPNE